MGQMMTARELTEHSGLSDSDHVYHWLSSFEDALHACDRAGLERLFVEFQQLETGLGRRQEGTGLGLVLTKRFAQLHGGDVTVRSTPKEGSTFTIRLPVA